MLANAAERLAGILQVAATASRVLLHFAASNDRTGIAVALLLSTTELSRTTLSPITPTA
ncbi:tyrosine-protein phosphatase [Nocardia jinanensis]|uniref:tyrosine-protein phosphatase n=1 Tax=Nocardia jinanensis TaxID=382504 RepID=UPI001E525336|nr:tyrosine-protein phosphatase [Nocardia jinanensis]